MGNVVGQISLFDGTQRFRIEKPIRLIELFAGIGSQAKALTDLGVEFEHYRICEFDKYAVTSYNAVHGTDFKPSDIRELKGEELGITDTDKYCYILTYSFPCQDLSNAGKGAGMAKGSSTRSGLLWEVERLLTETKELPTVLVMENVPQVVSEKNTKDFAQWVAFLDGLGYKSKWEILNAKDYGIPQNRERCFMVSILGDYFYEFPKTIPLTLRLKDMLETTVEEKYYLSKKGIEYFRKKINDFSDKRCEYISPYILSNNHGAFCGEIKDCEIHPTLTTDTAPSWKHILLESLSKYELSEKMKRYINSYDDKYKVNDGNLVLNRDIAVAKTTREGSTRADASDYISLELSNNINIAKMDCTPYRIRKLTPKECWRLMGFDDIDIEKAIKMGMSNAQLYKQAGNSIVVNVLEAIFGEMLWATNNDYT